MSTRAVIRVYEEEPASRNPNFSSKVQKQAKSASRLPRSNDGQMPEVEADSAHVEFHRGTSGALLQLARS